MTIDADRWTAYDGANPWADFDQNGDILTRYLNGREMDQRFARYDVASEETSFYLTDNINSVRQIAQTDGTVLYSANFTAFGMIDSQSGAGGDRFKYTGRELDASGLYYYRARYYGAGIGRFLAEDKLGFDAGDQNLYRYVGNEPPIWTDPTGHIVFLPWLIIGGVFLIGGTTVAVNSSLPDAIGEAHPELAGKHNDWYCRFAHKVDRNLGNGILPGASGYAGAASCACGATYVARKFGKPADNSSIWQHPGLGLTRRGRDIGRRFGYVSQVIFICEGCIYTPLAIAEAFWEATAELPAIKKDWDGKPLDAFGKPTGRWYPSIKYE